MKQRPRKERTFLDDPGEYDEFSVLVYRQGFQHRVRLALHRNRTVALVALAAFSAALSGANAPHPPHHYFSLLVGRVGGEQLSHHAGDTGGAVAVGDDAVRELWAFLVKGLALDLLGAHFEGIGSALACMLAIAASSVLVYPLHRFSPVVTRAVGWPSMTSLFEALAAALPSLLAWGMAVWGAGQLRWGLASGLSVGLLTACLSLKAVSFTQACVPFEAAAGVDVQRSKLAIAAAPREKERGTGGDDDGVRVVSTGRNLTDVIGSGSSGSSGSSNTDTKNGDKEHGGAHKGGNTSIETLTPAPTQAAPVASSASSSAHDTQLTFGEFLFFLLAAPSLVCEPRFLKASARHPPCITRAASEFFHAGLTFLAIHAACSALVAPTFRVLATASVYYSQNFSASCDAGGAAGLGESDWVDVPGWTALKAGGSGGWFLYFLPRGDQPALGGGDLCDFATKTAAGWVETVAALAWGLFVLSPLVHFGTFYGFWHCVCLGCAELWGYPDRNLYGPWWLLTDDPRAMFRMWSAPVHRWLSSCIYRPIMAAGEHVGPEARDGDGDDNSDTPGGAYAASPAEGVDGGCRGKEGRRCHGDDAGETSRIVCDGNGRAVPDNGKAHVGGGGGGGPGGDLVCDSSAVQRRACGRRGGAQQQQQQQQQQQKEEEEEAKQQQEEKQQQQQQYQQEQQQQQQQKEEEEETTQQQEKKQQQQQQYQQEQQQKQQQGRPWRRLLALCCVFSLSSLVHEAVTFVAMRWTCWPFNTFSLVTAVIVIASWDYMYPVRNLIRPEEPASPPPTVPAATTAKSISPSSVGVSWAGGNKQNNTWSQPSVGVCRSGGQEEDKTDAHDEGVVAGGMGAEGAAQGRLVTYRKVGSEWRGWGAVAFFEGCSIPMALVVDFLAWQWWRHTLLE